ncbi:MAG TPA: CPBP family intramembrane glutamic endopeptidase [Candidatus Elarobacter sp.]|jgi:membrane protease YdiL (CAAX protease family)|nr:CPBP family intramembrane glutamic endopeptidase [Candidatus Elarobacter sp.]
MGTAVAQPRSRIASVVGLAVALGVPFVLPLLPGQAHQRVSDVRQDTVIVVFEWILALAVLAIVVFWERLPLRSIGFRAPSWRQFAAMAGAFVVMILLLAAFAALTHGASESNESPAAIATVPLAFRVLLFLTAGFCEELVFRAYAIERLALFTGKLWIAGAVSVVLFALAHVPRYGFSASLAAVGIIAAVLSALYLWTRNFWVCATMHAIIDCLGLVVAPALATRGMHG